MSLDPRVFGGFLTVPLGGSASGPGPMQYPPNGGTVSPGTHPAPQPPQTGSPIAPVPAVQVLPPPAPMPLAGSQPQLGPVYPPGAAGNAPMDYIGAAASASNGEAVVISPVSSAR